MNTKALSGFLRFSLASIISATVGFLLTPVITRLIAPEQLAYLTMFTTYSSIFIYVASLGTYSGYMRFYSEPPNGFSRSNLLSYSVKASMIGSVLVSVFLFIFYKPLSNSIIGYSTLLIPVAMSLYILAYVFLDLIKTEPRMENNAFKYTVIVVLINLCQKTSYLCYLPLRDYIKTYFIIAAFLIVIAIAVLWSARKKIFLQTSGIPYLSQKTFWLYSLPMVPMTLMSNLNTALPKLLINRFCTKTTLGIYSAALTLVNILQIIHTGFRLFWAPYVYSNYRNKQKELQKIQLVAIFGIVLCGLIIILFQDVVYLVLGEKYRLCRTFFPLLLSAPILVMIGETVGVGIDIAKKSYINVIITGITLAVNLTVGILLIPVYGNVGAAIGVIISSITSLIVKASIGNRIYKMISSMSKFIFSLILFIVVAVISLVFTNHLLIRMLITIVAVVIHCIIFNKELISFVNSLIGILKHVCYDKR